MELDNYSLDEIWEIINEMRIFELVYESPSSFYKEYKISENEYVLSVDYYDTAEKDYIPSLQWLKIKSGWNEDKLVSFEHVFEQIDEKKKDKFLFYLDIFRGT